MILATTDLNSIQTMITTVGFPIFCVLALGWFIYQSYQKITERNEERENKLYTALSEAQEQMDKVTDTNAQFVEILKSYKTDIEDIKNDVSDIKERIR